MMMKITSFSFFSITLLFVFHYLFLLFILNFYLNIIFNVQKCLT